MLEIVQAPNNILSQKAKPVTKVTPDILKIISGMEEALLAAHDPIGVGLAAPQVGVNLQIFVIKPTNKSPISVFINPKVKTLGKATKIFKDEDDVKLEGCLSLLNIWGEVKRSSAISVSYMDETGKQFKKNIKGFTAIIIQHEADHLNGILFPRRVLEQGGTLYKSSKNTKGEDEFEAITI